MSSSWDEDCKLILSHCCLFRHSHSRVRGVHLSLLKALFLDLNLMENNVGVEWERPLVALADGLQIRKTVDAHAGLSGDGVIRWLSIRGMACICCNFWEKKIYRWKMRDANRWIYELQKLGIAAQFFYSSWPFTWCHTDLSSSAMAGHHPGRAGSLAPACREPPLAEA